MNALYLILISLGFLIGVLTTTIEPEKNILTKNIYLEDTSGCNNSKQLLSEPETNSSFLKNFPNNIFVYKIP